MGKSSQLTLLSTFCKQLGPINRIALISDFIIGISIKDNCLFLEKSKL